MSWDRILQIESGNAGPLRRRIDALFAQQRATWPALRAGEAALRQLQTKQLTADDGWITVQVNPARRQSTHAKTDAQSIAARPCFLCPENMPPEERGVAFEDLVILPNPFPVVPLHCTIADRRHRPQRLAGRVATMLRLAAELGPDMAVFYNGPRCGASAPDHFHLQASLAAPIPILSQLPSRNDHRRPVAHASFGRAMLIFDRPNGAELQADIERTIETLRLVAGDDDEPMFNLLARLTQDRYVAILFPRRAHRPACYFASGPEHLAVSPAVLEMAGLLVTTDLDHFDRIDSATARSIYQEVASSEEHFAQLAARAT